MLVFDVPMEGVNCSSTENSSYSSVCMEYMVRHRIDKVVCVLV